MERFIMFLNEAVKSKKIRTKSIVKPLIIIMIVVVVLFLLLAVMDGMFGYNDIVMFFILAFMCFCFYVVITILQFGDQKLILMVDKCLKVYQTDQEMVLKLLSKYNHDIKFNSLMPKINWMFYLSKAYESYYYYHQKIYTRIETHSFMLDVDLAKTEQLYVEKQKEIKEKDYSKLLKNVPMEFKKLLDKLSIDFQCPYQVEEFDFKDTTDYSIVYPVFGFVANDSGYLIDSWVQTQPLVANDYKLRIYETYIKFDKPAFLIVIEVTK